MSIDKLQDKIRKWKNPSVLELCADSSLVPPSLQEENAFFVTFSDYCQQLLKELKEIIPAVRFNTSSFYLMGSEGVCLLETLTAFAKKLDYYVLLDAPVSYSDKDAVRSAEILFGEQSKLLLDGVVICPYIGADAIKPYEEKLSQTGKDLFVVVRTGNKTAGQLLDLLSGSRLAHIAAADIASRMGQNHIGRRNYSSIACVGSAVSADSLRTLRAKHKNLFILAEGYDYPNANAKNCSYAFDGMGHGAAVCAGETITAAWKADADGDHLAAAVEAAQRMKKNLLRYITVL